MEIHWEDRRRSERNKTFRPAWGWLCVDGEWTEFEVRLFDESIEGVRMRARHDFRDKTVFLRFEKDSVTVSQCRLIFCERVARDCWEYGVELMESTSFASLATSNRVTLESIQDKEPIKSASQIRDERYSADPELHAELRYERSDAIQMIHVVDLSASGVGFLMEEVPLAGSAVVITIYDSGEVYEFAGVLRWAEPAGHGAWRAGCKFETSSLKFGLKENVSRSSCRLPVIIRQQQSRSGVNAHIRNYSSGGIGIETRSQLVPGQRYLIETEASPFFITVQWSMSKNGLTQAGGTFVGPPDRETFRTLIDRSQDPVTVSAESQQAELQSTRHLWSACLFIYGWVGLYLTGSWPV